MQAKEQSPIAVLSQLLGLEHIEDFEVLRTSFPSGYQCLNICSKGFEILVEWGPGKSEIGISSFENRMAESLYVPDEFYKNTKAAFHRIMCLMLEKQKTTPRHGK